MQVQAAKKNDRQKINIIYDSEVTTSDHKIIMSDGKAYIPLRYYCEMLGAQVQWNSQKKEAVIINNGMKITPEIMIADGKAMVPEDFFEDAFNINIYYFSDAETLVLKSNGQNERPKKSSGKSESYTWEDLYWLARIIHAEANGENYSSKLAVANVILNRVESDMYPNTIKGVVFDKKHGTQFTPTANGSIYNKPSSDCFLAAIEALGGKNNAKDTLFFINPKYAKSTWVSSNRKYAFTMGGHDFFY